MRSDAKMQRKRDTITMVKWKKSRRLKKKKKEYVSLKGKEKFMDK